MTDRVRFCRNLAAATTIMPLAWGITMMYILQAVFRQDMLQVFATFMAVASDRELTLYNSNAIVWCMFVVAVPTFLLVLLLESRYALDKVETIPINPNILKANQITQTFQAEKESLYKNKA